MMHGSKFAGWALTAAVAIAAASVVAQQDEGPVLKPKPKPKPAGATLLVICDLACNWKLDSEAKGSIDAEGSKKVPVSLGQHLVDATIQDGLDKVEQEVDLKTAAQTIVRLQLQPVRDARAKAEQDARDKAARQQQKSAASQAQQGRALFDQKQYAQAQPLLANACAGGSMDSCALLGWLYEHGQGVPQNYAQAVTLNQKA